ncbi:MAG: type 1 glutamine amidotransferase [Nocardioidaceae bacterium]
MPGDSDVRVVLVYPDLLGTYGDRGNALALAHRAEARGLTVSIVEVNDGESVPTSGDVYLLGGSEDATQLRALANLRQQPGLRDRLRQGPTLAVCAGFQILSRDFLASDGGRVEGLGVFDVSCGRPTGPRAVGEVLAESVGVPGLPPLSGYENHQGAATLDQGVQPLGRLRVGVGNGDGRTEGAVQDGAVGTYLHGPVLVRNPDLADHLLEQVAGSLPPLEDESVARLRRERLAAAHQEAAQHARRRGSRASLAALVRSRAAILRSRA